MCVCVYIYLSSRACSKPLSSLAQAFPITTVCTPSPFGFYTIL